MSAVNTEPEIETPDQLLEHLVGRFAEVFLVGRTHGGVLQLHSTRHPSEIIEDLEKVIALLRES